jgi:hypothetical protein
MSNGTATAVTEDFKWEFLDENLSDDVRRYGSVFEMHTAPLQLTGVTAAKFAAAKRRRVPRSATPLSLD